MLSFEGIESGKRTLIDSIKLRDYQSIMRRVIDDPHKSTESQENKSHEEYVPAQEEIVE